MVQNKQPHFKPISHSGESVVGDSTGSGNRRSGQFSCHYKSFRWLQMSDYLLPIGILSIVLLYGDAIGAVIKIVLGAYG